MIYNELKQRGTEDFPIEFYYIDKNHARYDMSAHWHSEVEIIRILDGRLNVKLDNKSYIAEKGDIVFVNSETVHSAVPENCVYECIVFQMDFLYTDTYSCKFFIESILNREYVIREFSSDIKTPFHCAANEVFDIFENKSSGYKFLVIGALYKMFGVIIDNHLYSAVNGNSLVAADKNLPKLKKILSFLRENYDTHIPLENMAKAVGMSAKYFCYFFKDMTGKTPVEYLNGYRVEKASQKLINTDLSVTEVAFLCGFNDLSYFIKPFKGIKGISPAKFRKSVRD